MRKVLVVEDDQFFRLMIEMNLKKNLFDPVSVESGRQALQIIASQEIDLVVSDIRMPEMDGVELLKAIKSNTSIPVVLMTGFSEIIETHQAAELGADGFLPKPFKTEELVRVIDGCFPGEAPPEIQENLDSQFCKINIEDFISGREMRFDIFVRISEKRYVKVAHGGENLPPDRIQLYKDKSIRFLYMRREEFARYLGFNITLAQSVTRSKQISHVKKVNFLKHTSEVLLQKLRLDDIHRDDYLQASGLVENAVSLLSADPNATEVLHALTQHTDHLYAHSVGVSFYCALVGKVLGFESPTAMFKLAVAGLLHDVGKKQIEREILDKTQIEQTPEDVLSLESHVTRGTEILAQLQCVPPEVIQVIHQHHENPMGSGYPHRLKRSKLHPLSRVLAIVDDFCKLVIKNPNSPGMSPEAAVERLMMLKTEYRNEQAMHALIQLFALATKGETRSGPHRLVVIR